MAPAQRPPAGVPAHVGIIMDGNGRWAEARGKHRRRGHLEGVKAAKRIVKAAHDAGVRFLTLYTFSTENWRRSAAEVSYLMYLIRQHLKSEYAFYRANRIRVVHSGSVARLPRSVVRELDRVIEATAGYQGMTVNLAIDYGGRAEILRAVNRLRQDGPEVELTEEAIACRLDHPEIPDPDLIIRTGAECRLSNFLLWQMAYSELYFSQKLWPDWTGADLQAALEDFRGRERRFGTANEHGRPPRARGKAR